MSIIPRSRLFPCTCSTHVSHSQKKNRLPEKGQRAPPSLRDLAETVLPPNHITGRTAMHNAAFSGDLEIVQLLHAQYGASLIETDSDGYGPLHLAVLGGHLEVVKWMVTQECR